MPRPPPPLIQPDPTCICSNRPRPRADDPAAETILIGAIAAASDVLDTRHMNSTACVTTAAGRRWLLASGIEILVPVVAPFVSTDALGTAIIGDVNDALDDGSFVSYLRSFTTTACFTDSVAEAIYVKGPTAAPTAVPTAARTDPRHGRTAVGELALILVLVMCFVGVCAFGLILAKSGCTAQQKKKEMEGEEPQPFTTIAPGLVAIPMHQPAPILLGEQVHETEREAGPGYYTFTVDHDDNDNDGASSFGALEEVLTVEFGVTEVKPGPPASKAKDEQIVPSTDFEDFYAPIVPPKDLSFAGHSADQSALSAEV